MSSAAPLTANSRELTTTDPGRAHDWLRVAYAGYEPEETNSRRNFRFRAGHRPLGHGGVSRLAYSTSADNNLDLHVLLVLRPAAGAMKVSLGREEVVVSAGTPVLFPAHQAVSVLWCDTEALCVCLPAADVQRVAVETTGIEPIAVRFAGLWPMSSGAGRRWDDVARHALAALLPDASATGTSLLAGRLAQRLAEAVLDTFPSTTLASHRRIPPDHATPPVVRRAVDFIDAHAERELTLTEIAAASGIGPRGLQAAFLRHRDTTPAEYARRVRMENAHRDLRAADPAGPDPVASVAARWGFTDLRVFALAHLETYQRLPGDTVRG